MRHTARTRSVAAVAGMAEMVAMGFVRQGLPAVAAEEVALDLPAMAETVEGMTAVSQLAAEEAEVEHRPAEQVGME